ncbi:MAG: fumarylacetoacetate hydrolase family protein [Paracoccaceae bacterium]
MENVQAAAAMLADLRLRENGVAPPLDDLPAAIRPADIEAAYAVQAALRLRLAPRLGGVAGWKIGCTSAVMQKYLGVDHPCTGTLFSGQIHHCGARLRASAYRRLGLECEIAVRLGADLSEGADPAAAVAGVMCSVEIVEERFTDFSACAKETLIADDFFSIGCVLGAESALDDLPPLASLKGRFTVDCAPGPEGTGAAILGDPLAALGWLAARRATEGGLKAGEVITLGSVVKTIYPVAGQRIEARFDGLRAVTIEVV